MESLPWIIFSIVGIISVNVSGNPLQNLTASQHEKTAASPPILPPPLCTNKVDIVLAIDSSGSMESTWNATIDSAQNLISNFQVNEMYTRVSVLDYSVTTNMFKSLDANNKDYSVRQALETLRERPQLGETWPELALDRAADIFSTANPIRNESRKALVLFTDGEITSNDTESVTALMKYLKLNNIEVYVKECGNKTSEEAGLRLMASRAENMYGKMQAAKYGQPLLQQALCFNPIGQPISASVPRPINDQPRPDNMVTTLIPSTVHAKATLSPPTLPSPITLALSSLATTQTPPPLSLTPPLPLSSGEVTKNPYPEPEPEPGHHLKEKQGVYGESGLEDKAEPEAEHLPAPRVDIFNPQHSCTVERDFAQQRKGSLQFVGVFLPECDSKGNFKPLQRYGSTGEKWCVDPITGRLIEGTKRGPAEEDPSCEELTTKIATTTPPIIEVAPTTIPQGATPSGTTIIGGAMAPPTTTTTAKAAATLIATTQTSEKPTTATSTTNATNTNDRKCEFVIGENLVKLGCFRDTHEVPQPLPVPLVNNSIEGYRVKDNQKEFASFIKDLVCECANTTRSKGWFTFGIQNYGICYSGPDEGRYSEDGVANEASCISEEMKPCSMNDTLACTGIPRPDTLTRFTEYANLVYLIKTKEHQAIHVIEYDRKRSASQLSRSVKKDFEILRQNKIVY